MTRCPWVPQKAARVKGGQRMGGAYHRLPPRAGPKKDTLCGKRNSSKRSKTFIPDLIPWCGGSLWGLLEELKEGKMLVLGIC